MSPADAGLPTGSVLVGKYRIEELRGRGGMALVFLAHHLQLDEPVAIKVLREDAATEPDTVQRFVREAEAAVRLKSEHVARIQTSGRSATGCPTWSWFPHVAALMHELAAFAGNAEAAHRYVRRAHRMHGLAVPDDRESHPSLVHPAYELTPAAMPRTGMRGMTHAEPTALVTTGVTAPPLPPARQHGAHGSDRHRGRGHRRGRHAGLARPSSPCPGGCGGVLHECRRGRRARDLGDGQRRTRERWACDGDGGQHRRRLRGGGRLRGGLAHGRRGGADCRARA